MSEKIDLPLMNGSVPSTLYSRIPCTVGYSYIRFEVDGTVRPCCVARHPIGSLAGSSWRQIWRSAAYQAFRTKMARIHLERFHLTDPEFVFCQQCSHMGQNINNASNASKR
ncbi:MAG: SPASM domain-containing protein [Bdellovibrionota bacterium]